MLIGGWQVFRPKSVPGSSQPDSFLSQKGQNDYRNDSMIFTIRKMTFHTLWRNILSEIPLYSITEKIQF